VIISGWTKRSHHIIILTAMLFLAIVFAPHVYAQGINPPPRQDAESPQGVSYRNGTFSYDEEDLSIGGEFPIGLSLRRTYNSAMSGPSDIFPLAWTHSLLGYVSNSPIPHNPDDLPPLPNRTIFIYNLTLGGKSYGFVGGSKYPPATGGPVGTYKPLTPNGASLVFNGTTSAGYYTFTGPDGAVVNLGPGSYKKILNWTFPDGTRLDYTYAVTGKIQSVISNRGYALIFEEPTKICAVNMAYTYITAASACPADAQSVTYGYTPGVFNPPVQLLTSVTKAGQTTNYSYVGADHLGCIKLPGQAVCSIQNQYAACPVDPNDPTLQASRRYKDPVIFQQTATGETYTYVYALPAGTYQSLCESINPDEANYYPFTDSETSMTTNTGAVTGVISNTASVPISIRDPINRVTNLGYFLNDAYIYETSELQGITLNEGNREYYQRDDRGNFTSVTKVPKSGSPLTNITTSASYPTDCPFQKTCNKPDYIRDAKNAQTDYTYASAHGGMLSEMQPPPVAGAPRPLKLYGYAQKYAYVKTSPSTYGAAATPVWVLTTETQCQTVMNGNSPICDAAALKVVTTYDYGPNSGPNTLLLRGKVVDQGTGKLNLRTCYGYDQNGNKISETAPKAGLTSCP